MNNGYWLKLIRVNLTERNIFVEDISEDLPPKYLGGSGLASKYLIDEVPGKIDPLSPENKLIFATGPFQMSTVPGSGRWVASSISPLTGIWGEANAGGHWGPRLKRTGYDLIIIEGSSDTPVYLVVTNDEYDLHDATHIWGRDTRETNAILKKELGSNYSILTIGQSGEKQIPMACIASDDTEAIAGRTGMGAVMGSKKLKAIAVSGRKIKRASEEERLEDLIKETRKDLKENPFVEFFRIHGQPAAIVDREKNGLLPIKNWREGTWKEGAEKIGAPTYTTELKAKPRACSYCPIGCTRKIQVKDGSPIDHSGRGPEYETLAMMGSLLLIDDLKKISYANDLCNRYGIDTISVGGVIAFIFECFEKGVISQKELDGIEARWGNADALISLVKKIALGEGIGILMGKGSRYLSGVIGKGSEEWAIHVKNLEVPAHDPRAYFSMAVTYATSPRGACHLRGCAEAFEMGFLIPEVGVNEGEDRFTDQRKGYAGVIYQDVAALYSSLIQCMVLPFAGMTFQRINALVNAINGWDLTPLELLQIGERITNIQHLLNLKHGMTSKENVLPKRLQKPLAEGGTEGNVPNLKVQLDEYYHVREWDENAIPSKKKLIDLGLEEYLNNKMNEFIPV